ncbi:helix-turn-helix transcriptional regulator [Candidatus Borrarchaeum sp.]|uniref:helix-turn-helix domain-containing protein n=1 Tax=Candidatus Borrarchaeum sp. TaxID=2846742 RepID=UPI00257C1458|nr:helix-turn-helix transcriptional regulator [Candidatus Borrarchaeum sp.]
MDSLLGAPEFKKLIRETSVREYFVELKEDALTEQGFFNLVKVPGLRIARAGKFLKKLRIANRLTRSEFAKIFKLTRSQVRDWENNSRTIPLKLLVKIAEKNGVSKDSVYSLIDSGVFKTKSSLPVKFEKIKDIIHFFYPTSPNKSNYSWPISIHSKSKEALSKIKAMLNISLISDHRWNSNRTHSKELHNFLKTFFRYNEILKINPPLTSEVKRWFEMGIDLKSAIIIPCLQSDGGIGQFDLSLMFSGNSKILHDYFVDAMYYEYGLLPTSYFKQYKVKNSNSKVYYYNRTEFVQNSVKDIIDEVM